MRATISDRESGDHSYGVLPKAAFTSAGVTRCASPVATSATHSSSPVRVAFTYARRRPSGDQRGKARREPAGTGTRRLAPEATSWKVMPVSHETRLGAGPL